MSLQHTESFIAFEQVLGDDAFNPTNVAAINKAQASLRRGGYIMYARDNAAASTSGGFVVRADPVTAGRAALVHSCAGGLASVSAAIRRRLPLTRKPLIGGFSLYIPPEFVKSAATGRVVCMRVMCPTGVDTAAWQVQSIALTTTNEVFRINSDLTIQWGNMAPLSDRSLEPGRMAYLEYAITDTEVRVWLDNILVLQRTVSLIRESIAIAMEPTTPPAPGTAPIGTPGRWAISNWYNLYDDGINPTSRLGPATRVIGVRPAVDVAVQFQRPSGAASNAAIASQDLVDSPPNSLQALAVGAQDIYASNLDTETAAGSLIHGISVKVMAGSLDGGAHTIRPLIRTQIGTEAVQPGGRALTTVGALPNAALVIDAVARNTDGHVFAITAGGLYECAAGDGKLWEPVTVLSGIGADATCITCRSDGTIIVGLKASRGLAWLPPPGSAVTPQINAAVGSAMGDVVSIGASPLGHIVVGGTSYRVARSSALPASLGAVQSTFTVTTLTGGAGNTVAVASNRAGDLLCICLQTSTNVYRAPAPGYTWAAVNSGAASFNNTALASDGDQVGLFTNIVNNSTTYFRRSPDGGLTWTDYISQPNFNIAEFSQDSLPLARGDYQWNQAGIFVAFNGRFFFIPQGGAVPYAPAAAPGVIIEVGAAMPNGTWMLFGTKGEVMAFDPQAVDALLPAFSGFVPSANISTINPDTGAPWTPAEASVAQFGMRISS